MLQAAGSSEIVSKLLPDYIAQKTRKPSTSGEN
jgi:hypothetical protein